MRKLAGHGPIEEAERIFRICEAWGVRPVFAVRAGVCAAQAPAG